MMTSDPSVPFTVAEAVAEKFVHDEMRRIADFVRTWEMCGRPACRRSRRCRDRAIACFDAFAEPIRGCLAELADWDRLDGPYDDDRRYADAVKVHTALIAAGRRR